MQLHEGKIVKFHLPSSNDKWRIGVIQKTIGRDLYNIKEVAGRLWSAVPKTCIKAISLVEVTKMQKAVKEKRNKRR